ncbi:MFS transporter [Amycolatopsis anabasis]|uniref:MFS transporter n=1 Tax=Amycolatopsis anabasis TaxID=1840409 RepID=UPI00131C2C64|nr:MFS transporter [Amycolatopsis anabasis]
MSTALFPVEAQHRRTGLAVGLVAYAFAATMAGTTLPTPLYQLYQQQFGFGSLLTTVIYAVYAAGVVAMLLLFGRASDALGRRPLLLTALATSALSSLVFLTDAGLPVLFLGRIVSGFSAGLVTAAATVAMAELAAPRHRARATMAATAVNMLGLGCGPLLAGLLADHAPAPLRLPFLVHLALLALAVAGLWRVPETVPPRDKAPLRAALRPRWPAVPEPTRAVFIPAAIAVFAAFAVFGLLTAVEPGLLATLLPRSGHLLAGAVVFSMFAGSALSQVASVRRTARTALPAGCLVLVLGLAGIGTALTTGSPVLLVLATFVVGIGQGVSFRAGMTAVTEHSPADRRAETVSAFTVVAYLGISVPVVLVGVAAAFVGLHTAAMAFTVVVAVVALAALAAILRLNRRRRGGSLP